MVYPKHVKVVLSGVIGATTAPLEDWSFSVKYAAPQTGPMLDKAFLTTAAAGIRTNFEGSLASLFISNISLTQIKVSNIDTTGLVVKTPQGEYEQGTWVGVVGGQAGAGIEYPLQTACVVSLKTARAGASGKGRFFLPWPKATLAADRRMAVLDATNVATQSKNFINYAGTTLGAVPWVVSSKGFGTSVTGVRVGRAPDTLRSRRHRLLEAYIEQNLA
jgi:hypothetical protein